MTCDANKMTYQVVGLEVVEVAFVAEPLVDLPEGLTLIHGFPI